MKQILRQFEHKEQVSGGYIPHSKIIIFSKENEVTDETIIYIGSHNFTKSAWGAWGSYNKYHINNTELGMLFPPAKGSRQAKKVLIDSLPFVFPPKHYSDM